MTSTKINTRNSIQSQLQRLSLSNNNTRYVNAIREIWGEDGHNKFTRHLTLPFSYNHNILDLLGRQYLMGIRFKLEGKPLPIKWEFRSLLSLHEKQLSWIPTHEFGSNSEQVRFEVLPRLSIQLEQLLKLICVQGWPTNFGAHFQLIEIHKLMYGGFDV